MARNIDTVPAIRPVAPGARTRTKASGRQGRPFAELLAEAERVQDRVQVQRAPAARPEAAPIPRAATRGAGSLWLGAGPWLGNVLQPPRAGRQDGDPGDPRRPEGEGEDA